MTIPMITQIIPVFTYRKSIKFIIKPKIYLFVNILYNISLSTITPCSKALTIFYEIKTPRILKMYVKNIFCLSVFFLNIYLKNALLHVKVK